MSGILSRVPGIVATALKGVGIVSAAEISRPGSKVSDGRGGRLNGSQVSHACEAIVTDYTDFQRAAGGGQITIRDRRAIITAQGLAIIPARGDTFTQGGTSWSVIEVTRDPAGATYELQLRPAGAG